MTKKTLPVIIISLFTLLVFFLPYPVFADNATPQIDKSELQKYMSPPQTKINLPGLHFTKLQDVINNTSQKVGPDGKTSTYLSIPFLGEYLAAVYRYAIVVISIIAVIMIIIAGLQWTSSAGNAQTIQSAQKRITHAIIGLLLASGSYLILFTINPELVRFKSLEVKYIEGEEFPSYPETLTAGDLSDADSMGPYQFQYFKGPDCPVQLDNKPVFDLPKNPTKPGSIIGGNTLRRVEYHQKILDQKLLTGTISERVIKAVEATTKCQIQYENCGVGSTNMYALAAISDGPGSYSDYCLKNIIHDDTHPCNLLGGHNGNIHKTVVHSVYNTKINVPWTTDPKKQDVSHLLQGFYCKSKKGCCPKPLKTETQAYTKIREDCYQMIVERGCIEDKQAASAKLRSILETTNWKPDWVNDLQPGDYYMIDNWNDSCQGTHSAMFLNWKDAPNHIANVEMADAYNFLRVGTKHFDDGDWVIQISRPVD